MYKNLLLILVAIFSFEAAPAAGEPTLPFWASVGLAAGILFAHYLLSGLVFSRASRDLYCNYYAAEKRLLVISLVLYASLVWGCELKLYLIQLPLAGTWPSLVSFLGLAPFFLFLALIWYRGEACYSGQYRSGGTRRGFVFTNIRNILPFVLPWMVVSLLYDVLALFPDPNPQGASGLSWKIFFVYGLVILFVTTLFPLVLRRFWGCKTLPDGPLRENLEEFCRSQNFQAGLYLWPQLEKRMPTAAVVGVFPGLRYILLTPGIIQIMDPAELRAVLAHEIGHVKRYHLLLYLLLICGFNLLASLAAEPFLLFLLSFKAASMLVVRADIAVETLASFLGQLTLFISLILYFRFVFGYFSRNFERQADLFSLQAVGGASPLVSAFEKISAIGGIQKTARNWHHFGIGERIDCLVTADKNPERGKSHNRKVASSLFVYLVSLLVLIGIMLQIPTQKLVEQLEKNLAAELYHQASLQPQNAIWQRRIGELMLDRGMKKEALAAYEKALELDPGDVTTVGICVWLLLASKERGLRDPSRALALAKKTTGLVASGPAYDTLAIAYWANGMFAEALNAENTARSIDPENDDFYAKRIHQFLGLSYERYGGALEKKAEK